MPTDPALPNQSNLAFVEELYADFQRDPASVPAAWRTYLEVLTRREGGAAPAQLGPSFEPTSIFHGGVPADGNGSAAPARAETSRAHGANGSLRRDFDVESRQDLLDQLVRAFRVRGHTLAQLDPLGLPRKGNKELDLSLYGLTEQDLDRQFSSRTIIGANQRTLREILDLLQSTYCRYIGVQFMHIDDYEMRTWLQQQMEGTQNRMKLGVRDQFRILTRLTDAVIFEDFIAKRFPGKKSFSLEGAETLIPLLDLAIEKAGEHSIDEIVFGMAHRGRLNVLASIMGKRPREIFREFKDVDGAQKLGRGDVKYHLGYSSDWHTTSGHSVHLTLNFNPSHLEFVNPVALGRMRAKQDRFRDETRDRGMVVLIHGDAAFAGEGIVQETLNLSELPGYRTGGALHIIVNNQVGFTTDPEDARSTPYCTDVAKMLQSPIFHVNGENPEAVAQVVHLAMEFRRRFKRDVFIDMYCYRRRGHNETDEPAFTQPVMYAAIGKRPNVRASYLEHLLTLGGVTREAADEIEQQLRARFEAELEAVHEPPPPRRPANSPVGRFWRKYHGGPESSAPVVETAVPQAELVRLLEASTRTPADFTPHATIRRVVLDSRRQMARGEKPLDWGAAEALAFASLVTQGVRVRVSGQDSERGTFSHRHAVLSDAVNGRKYTPLSNLREGQAPFDVFNSPLSEAGVLGFDYGYSLACPDGLVIWEAQFGDFVNAAQVIIDQFIVSAEEKWHRLSGIVMLLPHGFEGQGPEHSSARIERFMQLAAEDNIQVTQPSTPAQIFHLLRRQALTTWRKPLVVMTPKSLLRLPAAVSTLDELAQGRFQTILPDATVDPRGVRRILLCTGRIYYDLAARRAAEKRDDVAIVRLEQLYPMSGERIRDALRPYARGTPIVWVQDEPQNQGAWRHVEARYGDAIAEHGPLSGVYRAISASPATGSEAAHRLEQERLLAEAFAPAAPAQAPGGRSSTDTKPPTKQPKSAARNAPTKAPAANAPATKVPVNKAPAGKPSSIKAPASKAARTAAPGRPRAKRGRG